MSNVVYFNSTMAGASPLSQTLGSIITILDDCLVNGFGSVTLDSLVVSDGVAVATKGTGHNFSQIVTGAGPVIRIAGATPSGLNGDWRVTVTSSSQFTFACPGVLNGTASGTITAKRAPAGWAKAFAGTYKAAYRSPNTAGSQWYFRVDHSASATNPTVRAYKTMTDVDSGTRASRTGGISIAFSQAGNSAWDLVADNRTVYLRNTEVSTGAFSFIGSFGDFEPADAGDIDTAYVGGNVHLGMLLLNITGFSTAPLNNENAQMTLASGFSDQISRPGAAVYVLPLTAGTGSSVMMPGSSNISGAWPNALTGQTDVSLIAIFEGSDLRGRLRGIYAPLHKYSNLPAATAIPLPGGNQGIRLLAETHTGIRSGAVIADLTGPW